MVPGHCLYLPYCFCFSGFVKMLPNRKATFKSQVPGAFMIAVAWSMFSYFFSLYFDIFSEFQQYVRKSDCADHGDAVAVCVHESACFTGQRFNAYFEKTVPPGPDTVPSGSR